MNVFSTACPRNCYSTCSFKVHVENGKIVNIDPHSENKATPEGVCLKGLAYIERANSKDRILYPLIKNKKTGNFEKISWSEVLKIISEKINYFKNEFGNHSILFYAASGMSGLLNSFSHNFWEMIGGATTMYGNLCWPAGLEATRLTLGENKHNVPWDIENAKLIILWGKNSAESNIQEMIPIEKAQVNGAKLIVIDPRRTPSSERADLLVQIKPGTDAALALGIVNLLIETELVDYEFINKHVTGFDEFKKSVKKYTPTKVAEITGIDAVHIYRLAEIIGKTKPMTLIAGYGMQRYTNGGQTVRSLLTLSVLTGNIGKKGASWQYANLQSYIFDDIKEPESYYPSINPNALFRRKISMAKLGEDMLNISNPKLKMIWVERGNPITQNPDTKLVMNAFRGLDFRVVVEQFLTDTAMEADIILPAKNMFEQTDIIGGYWNPYVQLKPKVVEPAGEVKPETEIYYLLAKQMGFSDEKIKKYLIEPGEEAIEEYLKNKLSEFPDLDWEKLKQEPQMPNQVEEIAFEDLKFKTPSGKIELYSEQAAKIWNVNPLPEYNPIKENDENTPEFPLYFMSPNSKNRIHSQFNNLEMIKLLSPESFVTINPEDANIRGIIDEDKVEIYNNRGYVKTTAKLDYSIKKGCISMTNGWWIKQGGTTNFLSKARETDMGFGTAFHDNKVEIRKIERLQKK
ncbi:MAG: molybdopterin-dependent oxidoreductase [Bacteroidales bacterium]|nr:molybdopterin-dependent oxidoreductase [Bacteroidales bacterium]MBN2757259.1 molybdopterin-dependent oxidoreductase [Bacteroidales bacterium]